MGWTQRSGRVARDHRRPCLESLETRQLLSTASAATNSDGSTNFDQIIGASATRSTYNVDGTGSSVAVIDTGVNYNNAALGSGFGAGHKVIAGVDFTGSSNGVLPTWQHGTGVAGLIASSDPNHRGVAPGADIVALRVFGDNNQGSFDNIEKALSWVVQNHSAYNITAVNLSISDGGNYQINQFAQDGGVGQSITTDIKELDALNIPVVIAAGNSFSGNKQGMGFPAIVSDAISVTATDASDNVASNAQRLGTTKGGDSATTLAAPGVSVLAPSDGNNYQSEDGTSFAAPQVTGAIVLLQQMYENAYHTLPTVGQLEALLQGGATTLHDGTTNIDLDRLNILGSAKILGQQIAASTASASLSHAAAVKVAVAVVPMTPVVVAPVATAPAVVAPPVVAPKTPLVVTPPVVAPVTPVVVTPPVVAPVTPVVVVTPPVVTTPVAPQTEVFYNGVSIGTVATSSLASKYPNLFRFLKGSVEGIRIYGPKGSLPDLGKIKPTGSTVKLHPSSKVNSAHPKVMATPVVHAQVVATPKAPSHKAAKPKKPNSLLSQLFPFLL